MTGREQEGLRTYHFDAMVVCVTEDKKNPLGPTGDQLRANIARLRAERGMTKKELSDRVGELGRPIPPLGITRLEAGTRRVDADDLMALAAALNVSPGTLLLPHEQPSGDKTDPYEYWIKATGIGHVPWETAWRWMHGEYPAADVPPKEVRRFRAENKPYEHENPAREAYWLIRGRMEGAWHLELDGDDDGYMSARLTRKTEQEGSSGPSLD
ncbi:helix-turn-helix domain-containing protein [Kitasatospora sp. NPDC051914]|uniref:helix-turn-helix domain-containing protein n=1 Tax=Kitasatospora sp. NPDC051914 TaxID=3154945 RepID=UPI003412B3EF